jgi:LacI family transcriptional regulator
MFLADPFITKVVAGVANTLGENGFSLALAGIPAAKLDEAVLLRGIATDALCVMLSGPAEARRRNLRRIARLGQPIVLVQESIKGVTRDLCTVRQDDYGGGCALAQRVLSRGARDLLVLTPELAWPAVEARVHGIRDTAARYPRARVAVLSCGDEDFPATQAALDVHAVRCGTPDAVLAANDQMGIAAMKWLRQRGVRVPADVALTGFNAFDFWQYTEPLLTTVRSPAYRVGELAAHAVLQRLAGKRFERRDIVLPVALVEGETA